MSARQFDLRIAQALRALPPAALAAALRQLMFVHDLDGQTSLIADAWLLAQDLSNPDEISARLRDQMMRERRDMRAAGKAEDVGATELTSEDDPLECLIAAQAAVAWVPPPASLGGGTERAMKAADAAAAARQCLRAIQSHMRQLAEQERLGQLVISGIPTVDDVYKTRGLEDSK